MKLFAKRITFPSDAAEPSHLSQRTTTSGGMGLEDLHAELAITHALLFFISSMYLLPQVGII